MTETSSLNLSIHFILSENKLKSVAKEEKEISIFGSKNDFTILFNRITSAYKILEKCLQLNGFEFNDRDTSS